MAHLRDGQHNDQQEGIGVTYAGQQEGLQKVLLNKVSAGQGVMHHLGWYLKNKQWSRSTLCACVCMCMHVCACVCVYVSTQSYRAVER